MKLCQVLKPLQSDHRGRCFAGMLLMQLLLSWSWTKLLDEGPTLGKLLRTTQDPTNAVEVSQGSFSAPRRRSLLSAHGEIVSGVGEQD